MSRARISLVCLWFSQSARVLADWCLRMFVFLEIAQQGEKKLQSAWYLVTVVFIMPFIVLAPLNGILSNDLRKRWALVGSTAFSLGALGLCGLVGGSWLWALGLTALGMAVYSPTRYALLPAAAEDTQIPLPRVNGWIEMGGAAAIVGGVLLGCFLHESQDTLGQAPLPPAVIVALVLSAVALVTALPVYFASDVCRPERPVQAITGFFRDARRVLGHAPARWSLLGLAAFLALVAAGSGALINYTIDPQYGNTPGSLFRALVLVAVGGAAGSWLAGRQGHLYRCLGLVPWSALGLLAALAWVVLGGDTSWACLLIGLMTGLANVPLRTFYQATVPPDARGNSMAVMNFAIHLVTTALSAGMFLLISSGWIGPALTQLTVLGTLAAVGTVAAWRWLARPSVEQVLQLMVWPMYRVRIRGPGLSLFPRQGPVLVFANHSCWLDPFWLIQEMPRPLTPMMLSLFFDLPVIHWFVKHIFHIIRVTDSPFRRQAPELTEAVAALDRGQCVLIFPQGWLQRREGEVRRFAQGVWHILHAGRTRRWLPAGSKEGSAASRPTPVGRR